MLSDDSKVQLSAWKGEFGNRYTGRNPQGLKELNESYKRKYGISRMEMNKKFLNGLDPSARILEIGCNIGIQLLCLQKMGFTELYGIEPQEYALEKAKSISRGINIIKGDVFDIPFKDSYFDLVFTSGVLIHIHPRNLKRALKEICRCSKKFIWGFEYFSGKSKNIIYRGKRDLLWKNNYKKIYTDNYDLKSVKSEVYAYLENGNMDEMFLLRK